MLAGPINAMRQITTDNDATQEQLKCHERDLDERWLQHPGMASWSH
jgi:hypothetical protein